MPRPKRHRKICTPPKMRGFKPFGIPAHELETMMLQYDEYETIRLCDYENLKQDEAAGRMNISRPTFTRIYDKARKKVARALVEGKIIEIQGGVFQLDQNWYKCSDCHHTFIITENNKSECEHCNSLNIITLNTNTVMEKQGYGSEGNCICVHCNIRIPHKPGVPCRQERCPECGKIMLRENSVHHQQLKNKLRDK